MPNCGSPYLEWHHFDPPWHILNHHNSNGMIALCSEHHPKADAGAFTLEQLHNFKVNAKKNHEQLLGKFDWLRNKLLVVVGSCFFYETLTILTVQKSPVIWLRRDNEGYLLLNLQMLTTSKENRLWLEDNYWIQKGSPTDFECPPSGKLIRAKYANGDEIKIEFFELNSVEAARKHYPNAQVERWSIEFPITVVEVMSNVGGTDISFGPNWSKIPGNNYIRNLFSSHCHSGISIG